MFSVARESRGLCLGKGRTGRHHHSGGFRRDWHPVFTEKLGIENLLLLLQLLNHMDGTGPPPMAKENIADIPTVIVICANHLNLIFQKPLHFSDH